MLPKCLIGEEGERKGLGRGLSELGIDGHGVITLEIVSKPIHAICKSMYIGELSQPKESSARPPKMWGTG